MLASFLCMEFLLHILSWLHFYAGSFSYTSCAGFCFFNFYLGSFSYTSHAGFIFLWGVYLTHPMVALFFFSFSYTFHAGFFFNLGSFSMLASFLCGEFLIRIPYWLYFIGGVSLTHPTFALFSVGSFSYTSHAGFIFLWGVSLTHHVLVSFFNLGSLSCVSRAGFFFFSFYLGSFSYTSCAGFFFYLGSFSGMQSSLKTTPKEKSWMEDGPETKCEKVTLKTEKEPYNTLYRAEQNQTRTE